jgi:hypothetical protein
MSPEQSSGQSNLLKRIRAKRLHIGNYVSRIEPAGNRLTTLSITCSAIAALLTAGPAIGGENLMKALGSAGQNSPSWRLLCGGALVSSLVAAIANNLYRSHDMAARLSKAQVNDVRLETLETQLELGHVSLEKAAAEYGKCILEIPFVPSTEKRRYGWKRNVALDSVKGEILAPSATQVVGDSFTCSGSTSGIEEGVHLWLAVEINGRIWPKEGEVHVEDGGSWSKTIFEEGQAKEFALSLFAANSVGHKYICSWITSCEKTGGSYPELRRAPGMIRLWRVNGLSRS